MSSDSDDDIPLARSNGRGEFFRLLHSLRSSLFEPQPKSVPWAALVDDTSAQLYLTWPDAIQPVALGIIKLT